MMQFNLSVDQFQSYGMAKCVILVYTAITWSSEKCKYLIMGSDHIELNPVKSGHLTLISIVTIFSSEESILW